MAEVEVARDGAVQTITLNRPDVLNAFNRALHAGLREALKEARDPEVRAVVITGAGRGFCAGQDLTEFQEAPDVGGSLRETYHPNVLAIRALEKPVIAAVNGACAGAGLSLACACDIRIASDSAAFVPGFVGIGLIPDAGGTYFIHRLLGAPRAFEWMSSNRRLSAAEAHAWGLVSEVVEADALAARAAELRVDVCGAADARDRHDEAAVRPRRHGDARGAAGDGGAAPGGRRADGGLPRGRRRVRREARAALQRPLRRARALRRLQASGGPPAWRRPSPRPRSRRTGSSPPGGRRRRTRAPSTRPRDSRPVRRSRFRRGSTGSRLFIGQERTLGLRWSTRSRSWSRTT